MIEISIKIDSGSNYRTFVVDPCCSQADFETVLEEICVCFDELASMIELR